MKLKLHQVIDGFITLKKLVELKDSKLPVKLAYAVARNYRILQPEAATFDENHQDIYKELGTKIVTNNGQDAWSAGDNSNEINKRVNDLLLTEIEVNVHTIRLEHMGDTFSAGDMLSLDWMVDEDKKETE